ncbi:hypothetical protein SAMN04488490_0921 [Marinobacter sp. LV10R510-11A]|uniref:hypothetical protein n=1 Tax=Marinobacter sp. LV10R510-11A TaxID=1415568 RepID=UPI000BBF5565|nr:hypothetical protein [Marinobacter sp. LV10R510-11A]SOB75341.1 hypothetical protein SAMN04488490_0921 [Marinobacter sp. LV10R510-11A]
MRYLDEKNALSLLPIPVESLSQIETALVEIDAGMHGVLKGCISDLVKINKQSRHGKKAWGRFRSGRKHDLLIEFRFILFDEQPDPDQCFYSWQASSHGTPQAPTIIFHFERVAGEPPANGLDTPAGAYVQSRRIFSVPIQCILRNWGNVERGHMIYEHNISAMDFADPQFESASYIGLTSRNWQTRYKEHQRDALTGSELLFHTSLRKVLNVDSLVQAGLGSFELVRKGAALLSELEYVNLTYEEAMQVEEKLVERTLYPKGLNMIPGGFAGFQFLHKLGYLNRTTKVSVDERDHASAKYLLDAESGVRVAPWVKKNWSSDEFYEQVIFKRSNTLNRDQVISIRKYGNEWGFDSDLIANLVGANLRQVRDVLSEKYYSRVK